MFNLESFYKTISGPEIRCLHPSSDFVFFLVQEKLKEMVEWCWKGPEGAKEVGLEILSSKTLP